VEQEAEEGGGGGRKTERGLMARVKEFSMEEARRVIEFGAGHELTNRNNIYAKKVNGALYLGGAGEGLRIFCTSRGRNERPQRGYESGRVSERLKAFLTVGKGGKLHLGNLSFDNLDGKEAEVEENTPDSTRGTIKVNYGRPFRKRGTTN